MKNQLGFTLIEVLIYLALFGLVFSGLFVSAFAVIENIGRNDAQIMVQEEGDFLLAKIEREASRAVFQENDGILEINGIPLNNSVTRVSDLKFVISAGGGLETVSFVLSAGIPTGKNYSQDFSTVYSLHE